MKNTKLVVFATCLFLSLIPLFWFKPAELDLGGDSGRLYFYDPLSLIKEDSLYSIYPEATGVVESHIFNLPIFTLMLFVKTILQSPYLVILFFNSLKLVVGFLSIYAVLRELIGEEGLRKKLIRESAAIVGALFYIFSPMVIYNFDRALLNHNQVFLNPLLFYLLLRFFLTNRYIYLTVALLLTFIFSHNFAWISAPPIFAFYPLSILFIILYTHFIRKKPLPWKGMGIGFFAFLLLHAFHLVPTVIAFFSAGSHVHARLFSGDSGHLLDYFYGILPQAKLTQSLFANTTQPFVRGLSIIVPIIIVIGFIQTGKRRRELVLTGLFFLTVLYLLTANITHLGVLLYEKLYVLPGYTMFRNFIGQWAFIYYFFYAILFAQTLFLTLSKLRKKPGVIFSVLISVYFVASAWPFIKGELTNKIHFQSSGVKTAFVMDPDYKEVLAKIATLADGKVLTLPFADANYQVIHGINNGAYVGISTISYLAQRHDFSGYGNMAPFSEYFLELAKEKKFDEMKTLFQILNIRYIFHNSDPRIYDTTFPAYPYSYVRQYLPNDQKGYKEFIDAMKVEVVFEKGSYRLYRLTEEDYLPKLFVTTSRSSLAIEESNEKKSFLVAAKDDRMVPNITFERVNPTKYNVTVEKAKGDYMLIFSSAFHKDWKVFISDRMLSEDTHMLVNSYANGWRITKEDMRPEAYEMTIEMVRQRIVFKSLFVSLFAFGICMLWLFALLRKKPWRVTST